VITITRLGNEDAQLLITGARNKANEIGVPMCIAVTDEAGNLIAFERMNGEDKQEAVCSLTEIAYVRQPPIIASWLILQNPTIKPLIRTRH